MDTRLRNAPDDRDVVLGVLDTLVGHLKHCELSRFRMMLNIQRDM